MAEVGELTWVAEIKEVASSKREAESMSEGLEGLADQAREADGAVQQVGDSADGLSGSFGGLGRQAGFLSGAFGLLSSGLILLLGQLGLTQGAIYGVTGAVKGLYGWLAAGGLSGVLATASGYVSGFIGWLAAGSAGALAFGAALGAVLGLFGVWILKITGVLDWVRQLGTALADQLPGWARDAILAILSIFGGGLAVLGAMIVGFMEGGLQGAIERGTEVIQIFAGAWDRLLDGIWGQLTDWGSDVKTWAEGLAEDIATAATNVPKGIWNSSVPESFTFPQTTIGGQTLSVDIPKIGNVGATVPEVTLGGDTLNFPQLATGGMIEESGGAVLHRGEMVLPADVSRDVISALRGAGSGGGGGASVNIENQTIEVGDQTLDLSNLDRQLLETLADLIAEKQGDELSTLIG